MSWQDQFDATCSEIRRIYNEAIEPVERRFQYEVFRPSWFADTLKSSKPFVLFLGPFSAGKSTFINYLLGHDYLWTGPQPTTDKWTVILHGGEQGTVSGRILTSNADMPFRGLAEYGNGFLETFTGMQVPADLLRNVTLIDTPGVLESAKDVHTRNYDYIKVARWFIEHSDLIFVMFDPSKLDAGVELRNMFQQFRGHESKLRMVLNKADTCEPQELMRVYGSLFWSLSNLIHTTEPPRVYVSSFWNKPYRTPLNNELFDEEKADLMYDLLEVVPLQCLDKRVTAVMRRALDVQIHAHIVLTMREKIPAFFGKGDAKKKMLANMDPIFSEVATKYKLTAADFPSAAQYKAFFDSPQVHMSKFPKMADLEKEAKKGGENILKRLERVIRFDLPKLLQPLAQAAAVDPRKARKEKQGQNNAPPDKAVFLDRLAASQIPHPAHPPAAPGPATSSNAAHTTPASPAPAPPHPPQAVAPPAPRPATGAPYPAQPQALPPPGHSGGYAPPPVPSTAPPGPPSPTMYQPMYPPPGAPPPPQYAGQPYNPYPYGYYPPPPGQQSVGYAPVPPNAYAMAPQAQTYVAPTPAAPQAPPPPGPQPPTALPPTALPQPPSAPPPSHLPLAQPQPQPQPQPQLQPASAPQANTAVAQPRALTPPPDPPAPPPHEAPTSHPAPAPPQPTAAVAPSPQPAATVAAAVVPVTADLPHAAPGPSDDAPPASRGSSDEGSSRAPNHASAASAASTPAKPAPSPEPSSAAAAVPAPAEPPTPPRQPSPGPPAPAEPPVASASVSSDTSDRSGDSDEEPDLT